MAESSIAPRRLTFLRCLNCKLVYWEPTACPACGHGRSEVVKHTPPTLCQRPGATMLTLCQHVGCAR